MLEKNIVFLSRESEDHSWPFGLSLLWGLFYVPRTHSPMQRLSGSSYSKQIEDDQSLPNMKTWNYTVYSSIYLVSTSSTMVQTPAQDPLQKSLWTLVEK